MADLAAFLTAKYFPNSGESLVIGDLPVDQLAESYGTPLFVYDCAVLDRKYDALRSALPERFSIYYSIKANPCFAVVKHFLSRGCGIELASAAVWPRVPESGCSRCGSVCGSPRKGHAERQ